MPCDLAKNGGKNTQIHNIVLSTRVTVLYVTFPGLTYLIIGSLYLLTPFTVNALSQ